MEGFENRDLAENPRFPAAIDVLETVKDKGCL